jgi:beta-lactamase regulating signal transducer with metallopeptidase domain
MNGQAYTLPTWFRELAQSAADRLKLNIVPNVRVCREATGPAVFGFIRPLVLLPAEMFASASRVEIEHVLLHEFAHVKRRDPLASLVCLIVQLVYWFHPAAWLMRARLATLREVCCDAAVARVLREHAPEYRRTLLNFARRLLEIPSRERPLLDRLTFLQGHSQLLARLEWLQRPMAKRRPVGLIFAVGLLAVLIACCLPLARPVRQAASIESLASADPTQGFEIPPLNELEGCLQLRYAVLGMLAQQESASAGPFAFKPLPEESPR